MIELTIEVGKKFHKVHSYNLILIPHDTIVQFNRHILQNYLEEMSELKGIHIDIKYIHNNSFTLKKYLKKNL
jgi:hypothetical protein